MYDHSYFHSFWLQLKMEYFFHHLLSLQHQWNKFLDLYQNEEKNFNVVALTCEAWTRSQIKSDSLYCKWRIITTFYLCLECENCEIWHYPIKNTLQMVKFQILSFKIKFKVHFHFSLQNKLAILAKYLPGCNTRHHVQVKFHGNWGMCAHEGYYHVLYCNENQI